MKPAILLFAILTVIATAGLTSCKNLDLGGLKVGACYGDACVNVELPKRAAVTESGKEVRPVE